MGLHYGLRKIAIFSVPGGEFSRFFDHGTNGEGIYCVVKRVPTIPPPLDYW